MTPHLVRFNNGDEFDAMTKGGRRVHRFRAGTRAQIKRRFRRRERRTGDSPVIYRGITIEPIPGQRSAVARAIRADLLGHPLDDSSLNKD